MSSGQEIEADIIVTATGFDLQVMGDPAEPHVLVLPMAPGVPLDLDRATGAVERVGLQELVVADQNRWQQLDAVVAIPRLEVAT